MVYPTLVSLWRLGHRERVCGRYVSEVVKTRKGRWKERIDELVKAGFDLRYNVAPTTDVPVWLSEGQAAMHWGLIPHWVNLRDCSKTSTTECRLWSNRRRQMFG